MENARALICVLVTLDGKEMIVTPASNCLAVFTELAMAKLWLVNVLSLKSGLEDYAIPLFVIIVSMEFASLRGSANAIQDGLDKTVHLVFH